MIITPYLASHYICSGRDTGPSTCGSAFPYFVGLLREEHNGPTCRNALADGEPIFIQLNQTNSSPNRHFVLPTQHRLNGISRSHSNNGNPMGVAAPASRFPLVPRLSTTGRDVFFARGRVEASEVRSLSLSARNSWAPQSGKQCSGPRHSKSAQHSFS